MKVCLFYHNIVLHYCKLWFSGVLEVERLVSLVAGLLRQNNLQFLEVYKKEAVTAAQAFMKQLMIEELADAEDELNELTGSGEVAPSMDSAHWLKVLKLGGDALGLLKTNFCC